ncbi:ectoine/hydroxyectoine ABC transporter permease subunit EhuC [Halomonas huangheensis]|uniref:ABC transmembrane type-1 domain-containing protein n=1 Tax=Halomonas huangheensis TaxID=1178482 RepID=W1N684_9GAMM|nr:ectoine/hydroxyectoine ABC transporter permease subunit EhuC [Halomonas huangheensis]ALM50890.1 hypothetical protein AR456_00200 [Halomonas huangheensis]ERL51033.1 hypothetical protein BJB45_20795 [Halomonas huangheensis]
MDERLTRRSEAVFAVGFAGCIAGAALAVHDQFAIFFPKLMDGFFTTVLIAMASAIISIIIAVMAGVAKSSRSALLKGVAITYSEFFRGSSLLVQLFWLFYVLPHFGIYLDPLTVGILGISLNYGAYGSEIVRGAIKAVPKGQWEASTALNLSNFRAFRRVIMPQAVVVMIPPYATLMVQLLKGTSLVSFITISDLTFEAYQLDQVTGETVTIFSMVLAAYFGLAMLISILFRWLERTFMISMKKVGG